MYTEIDYDLDEDNDHDDDVLFLCRKKTYRGQFTAYCVSCPLSYWFAIANAYQSLALTSTYQ